MNDWSHFCNQSTLVDMRSGQGGLLGSYTSLLGESGILLRKDWIHVMLCHFFGVGMRKRVEGHQR